MKDILFLSSKYKMKYLHQDSGEELKVQIYRENGKRKAARIFYWVDEKWVTRTHTPEFREYRKEVRSCEKAFLLNIKDAMKSRQKKLRAGGRFLMGSNEFEETKYGCFDKIQAHYDEHLDRYGPYCPITGLEFTFDRPNNATGKGGGGQRNVTNLSHDRLINEIDYTRQNTLFTCNGWNMQRGNLSLGEMKFFMKENHFKKFAEILLERFPDKKYELTELENGAEHPQERR